MNIEFDPNNPLDIEIQKRIKELTIRSPFRHEETIMYRILHKRLADNHYSFRSKRNKNRIYEAIEIAIRRRMERTGMSRDDVIREAFCIHLNIPFYVDSSDVLSR